MWSRIEDTVPHHPKLVNAGPVASWLWICSLVYANRLLTDGKIETRVLPTLGAISHPERAAKRLVEVGLWEVLPDGWQIHDYHDFNPHADDIKRKREKDRVRKESARNPSGHHEESARNPGGQPDVSAWNPDASRARDPTPTPTPTLVLGEKANPEVLAAEKRQNGGNNGRSRRPIFAGQRFVIFDWMLEDLGRMLGPHFDAFDIHTWLDALDQQANRDRLVKAKADWWPWVQAELIDEAKRRGLPGGESGYTVSDQGKKNIQAMKGAIARIQGGTK